MLRIGRLFLASAALAMLWVCSSGLAQAAPANDNFANAQVLTGVSFSVTGTNAGATAEASEPAHAFVVGGTSVWFSWTAPDSLSHSITTFGSDFDTLLAVYTGASVSALTQVISSNDGISPIVTSRVTFTATLGTTYYIAIDGNGGVTGNFKLEMPTVPPANDTFVSPKVLSGSLASGTSYNIGATRDLDEPLNPINGGGPSVWWSWTAPATGTAYISTYGSDFDTLSSLYTGSSLLTLTIIGSNDDGDVGLADRIVFEAAAGTQYLLRTEGYSGSIGSIVVTIGYGEGTGNVADGAPPITNPLNGMTVTVISSRGGLVQLAINADSLSRAANNLNTNFEGTGGLLGSRGGPSPFHQFRETGAYVATSTATDATSGARKGRCRRTLVISQAEVGGTGSGTDTRVSKGCNMKSMKGKFAFQTAAAQTTVLAATAKPDTVSYAGEIELPSGLDLTQDMILSVGIGNIVDTVTITPKGAAKDKSKGTLGRILKVKVKFPRLAKGTTTTEIGQNALISLTLSMAGMSEAGFDTEGITATLAPGEESEKTVKRSIQVGMVLGGYAYEGLAEVDYKPSSKGDSGSISGRGITSGAK